MSKYTQWHDGNVKPVHIGVYQRLTNIGTYSFWGGRCWYLGFNVLSEVEESLFNRSMGQDTSWRGLRK